MLAAVAAGMNMRRVDLDLIKFDKNRKEKKTIYCKCIAADAEWQ